MVARRRRRGALGLSDGPGTKAGVSHAKCQLLEYILDTCLFSALPNLYIPTPDLGLDTGNEKVTADR